jgi:hypothetical protein
MQGALLWFNWQEISGAGEPSYGRYVYRQVMPLFPAGELGDTSSPVFFFDGDFFPESQAFHIPVTGTEERQVAERVAEEGGDQFFVIALYARGEMLRKLDRCLREKQVTGYRGLTGYPPVGLEKFNEVTGEMGLVLTASLNGRQMTITPSFLLSQAELEKMGLEAEELE